ncbi:MAG: hypothetical protein M1822_004777 [Bathelium mastoideum]|nr:MAG: hypothetical protein M1822_004777 [Bathelium mastoideum]
MGLNKDLGLKGNEFSNAGSAFFIAFLIAEIPNAYFLNKLPAAKWLGGNVALWGVAEACTAAAHDYHSLLAARIFLGIFEASIGPSLVLLSAQWYTKSEQAPRFAIWYTGLGLGQIVGGLVSFAFQHVKNTSFNGWKAMFVALGIVTIIVGLATLMLLPDSPMAARFLTDVEKAALLQHVSVNQTGVVNRRFKLKHLKEILIDPQVYLLVVMLTLVAVSSGVVTFYSATVISNAGFAPKQAALLNMPSGIVSISVTLMAGLAIRYTANRWAWFVAICIPGIIGGGLMSFLPTSNRAGVLIGVYLVNAIVAGFPITNSWTAGNVAGHTKRSVCVALLSVGFGIGNIIGPQTFRAKDAPQYIPAKISVLATQAASAMVAVVLFGYYKWANHSRDRNGRGHGDVDYMSDVGKWTNLTDRENPDFRYVY